MKTLSIVMMILIGSAFAQSSKHNYLCIADSLQAYNSDIYYDITPAEIEELLAKDNDARAPMVREMAKLCDVPDFEKKEALFFETYNAQVPACYPEAGNICENDDTVTTELIRSSTRLSVFGQLLQSSSTLK